MKHFHFLNRYLTLFGVIVFGFFLFSGNASAHLKGQFDSSKASLSSISHGSTYKPGDSITFAGYAIDLFPPGGNYETVTCQIAVGFGEDWYDSGNLKIRYHLGVIPADLVYHSDGKRYCEFNETFTVPGLPPRSDKKFMAMVYPIYGVSSSGGGEPNFWNYGSFWEHIYIDATGGGPQVYIRLNYHQDMCLGVSGDVIANYVKPNAKPCTFTSNPSNSDWNKMVLSSNSAGNGSESFNISGATFDRNGRLVLNVSCVDAAGKIGRASAVAFEQNCVCGIKPQNTDWHPGDTQDLSQSMSSAYSATDTERQCEYKCKNGYTWNGSACANTPAPVPNLKINNSDGPLTVNKGDNLNLTWPSVANATSCTGTGAGWAGAKSISGGSEVIVATTLGSTSYTLTCTGPGGAGVDSVAVTVVVLKPAPNLKINNSDGPLTVNKGDNLNLTWPSVANATSCTGTGAGWAGAKSISEGNDTIVATDSSTYTLTCTGPGGAGVDSVAVTVVIPRYTLNVEKLGAAIDSSKVKGTAIGIDCGTICTTKNLDAGTNVNLTATAGTNAVFKGWTGGSCSGTDSCSFNIYQNTTVTANFACKEYYELSGENCVEVPGECSTALKSCYTSTPAESVLCDKGDPNPYPPKYFAGKWTWICKGFPNSEQCSVNQCAIYKEVAP